MAAFGRNHNLMAVNTLRSGPSSCGERCVDGPTTASTICWLPRTDIFSPHSCSCPLGKS